MLLLHPGVLEPWSNFLRIVLFCFLQDLSSYINGKKCIKSNKKSPAQTREEKITAYKENKNFTIKIGVILFSSFVGCLYFVDWIVCLLSCFYCLFCSFEVPYTSTNVYTVSSIDFSVQLYPGGGRGGGGGGEERRVLISRLVSSMRTTNTYSKVRDTHPGV